MRAELSQLYRSQAQSQNKQLSMADALRDRDEEVRGLREEVRELREAKANSMRKEQEWTERYRLRDDDVKVRRASRGGAQRRGDTGGVGGCSWQLGMCPTR